MTSDQPPEITDQIPGTVAPDGARQNRVRCLWLTKGLGRGGVERLLVDMYGYVDPDRYDVHVGYVLSWKTAYVEALESQGAHVFTLGSKRTGDARWIYHLQRLVRSGTYDIIHTHAPLPALPVRVAPFADGPAIIHTEHNMWDRYRRPTRYLNALTYHRNRSVIAVSDSVATTIQPPTWRSQPPIRTIYHGTMLGSVTSMTEEQRREKRRQVGLPEDGFLIGTVANFTLKKDHRNLFQALTGTGPIAGAHLALVGQGPIEAELRQAVIDMGLSDRVTFLGARDDVFELLPTFDTFCLSSRYEGFPISLVEAMATGLPCIATSVGGIPEILDDQSNGLMVPPSDSVQLRTAIERFMTDRDLARRCGDGARTSAEKLDLGNAVRELETVYEHALHEPAPTRR